MKRPRDIHKTLIVPNIDELRTYGNLRPSIANPGKPGRPAYQYHLNENQTLLLSMFSRTERAAEVRKVVIETFQAYRNGNLTLSEKGKKETPNFANPAEMARAFADLWEESQRDCGPLRPQGTLEAHSYTAFAASKDRAR